ncbi:uncharacterized protein LOC115924186 [Strongylocentrotus purpuratus]|uniref:Reverse transcriptase domain-containing protein n=1 Tax=Strongylocentrotus purpuratus TaxID=7668 RepID=A0A7M7NXC5_STRPU|nr:uncharacterized protein LOC115924186 [Strongylocentrotus purpuratus]
MQTFKHHLIQLYGEPTQLIARQLQRDLVKSAKLTNHLAFLKRCRDSDTIPPGLQLKSSVDTPRLSAYYTKPALTSPENSKINQQLNPDDLSKVQSFNDHTAQLAFQTTKLKQIRKFDQLRPRKPIRTNDPPIKDTVVNLSQHRLSQAEHQVLSLGLNFAVAPKKIPFSDIVQQVEPKLRFLSKAAANDIRLKITNALAEAKPPKPNLSKVERSAIQDLRKNQSIHILQADKGNATVVMDQDAYEDKICDLLKDKETYSKLKRDPTLANERKINQQLLTLHRSDALPKALYFQLRSSSAKSPILFGQPKIHKPLIPLRPIISTRGSSCYNTARHLANILQPLVGQTQHHVTNSKHFIDILSKTKIQPSDTLVSFDVTSLFTSVPVDQACDIIKQRLISDPDLESRTKLTPDQIHDLLLTCLHSNSFKWRNDFYKQLQGAAMGSPLSPIIANIFMEHLEHQALKSADKSPSLWLRYVDDTFVIWPHSTPDLHQFLDHINNQHPSIKFTMETQHENSIPFLDVLITKTPSGFPAHQVYRKPTHTDRYLNFRSHHHPSVHQSVSNSLIRRAHQLSDKAHLQQELKHITHALTSINQYPRRKINTRTSYHKTNNITTGTQPDNKPTATIVLPYIGKTSHRLQRILRSANILVRHQSSHKLHSTLHSHKDKHPSNKRPGVYKIPCDCGKVYIGETGRDFDTRLKEHKTHHRRSDWDKSAIVKHAQQELHRIHWDKSHLITNIRHWHTRRVREAIEIHQHNTVPQDPGLHINSIWHPILPHHSTSDQSSTNSTTSTPTTNTSPIHPSVSPNTTCNHPTTPTQTSTTRSQLATSPTQAPTTPTPRYNLRRRNRRPTHTERHH